MLEYKSRIFIWRLYIEKHNFTPGNLHGSTSHFLDRKCSHPIGAQNPAVRDRHCSAYNTLSSALRLHLTISEHDTQWLLQSVSIAFRGKLQCPNRRVTLRRCCMRQASKTKRKCNSLKSGSVVFGGKGIHVPNSDRSN